MPVYKDINKNFFKKWTPEMSYVLGFFMADGSLDVNQRGSHYFSIQICDKDLLENIQKALGSNHKISFKKGVGNQNNRYRLQVGSKEMCNDLRNLGVCEKKTYNMKLPDVPNKYLSHFIRGYFDGDGNVWVGLIHKKRAKSMMSVQTMFTSCSKYFLEDLHISLKTQGVLGGCMYCKKNAFCLKYSIKDSIRIYSLMYRDLCDNLYLGRKKGVFDEFIKNHRKNAAVV